MSFAYPRKSRPANTTVIRLSAICLCAVSLTGCLNPEFVNSVTSPIGRATVPLAPGDTPFVHILFINASSQYIIDVNVAIRPSFQGFFGGFIEGIEPEGQHGFVVTCPVSEIGLGVPTDLTQPAMVLLPVDGSGQINVPAGAFPLTLKSGENYDCGDTVVFTIVDDRTSGFGINISTGRVEGTTQTGPFSGKDTFEVLHVLLQSSGTPPTQVP